VSRTSLETPRTWTGAVSVRQATPITGRWEIADDRKTWKTDFDLTYAKVQ
jgi:hypothetical protein